MTKTMKKILSVCLVVLMCITAAPLDGFVGLDLGFGIKASASELEASGSLGDNVTYTFDEATGALTITGSGDIDDSMASNAPFSRKDSIKSVTIGEGITSIGKELFNATFSLESVTLPTTLKKIGKYAFKATYSLKSITLPENLETICEGAFYNCEFTGITIPKGVKTIEPGAFGTCHSLTNLTVDPDNENYSCVDNVLFNKDKTTLVWYSNANSAESYTIPAGVKTIAEKAFDSNFNIKSIIMSDDVETIGNSAFKDCRLLTSVTLSNKLTTISQNAFDGCNLESIIIPEGVTKIESSAFYWCTNLKTIILPLTLTEIGNNAFYYNTALSDVCYFGTNETWNSITIGYSNDYLKNAKRHYIDTDKKLGDNVCYLFDSTTGALTVFGIGDMYDFDWNTAKFKDIKNDVKSIVISEGVTTIGDFAFAYCTSNVENISIAKSVTKIGKSAFTGCSKLTSLVIPEGVKSIDTNAFRDCYNIESLTLYRNLTSIAESAFGMDAAEELFKLESIYFLGTAEQYAALSIGKYNDFITRDAVNVYYRTSGKLGDNVTYTISYTTGLLTVSGTGETYSYMVYNTSGDSPLYGSKSIKKIVIESGVTKIGRGVFAACGFEEVTFPDTVKTISDSAFYDCTALKQVNLSASVNSIDHHAFSGCTALEKFTVPDDNKAFKSVDGILFSKDGTALYKYPGGKKGTAYTVPETVGIVLKSAFENAEKLVSIDFENDDTAISSSAFDSCTALENISLPKNLTCISEYLFFACSSLKVISIPASVTKIENSAFDKATSLEFIVIPNGVDNIDDFTFLNCSSLKGIIIPSSVQAINLGAFYGTTALTDVYYTGTEEAWESVTINEVDNESLTSATMHYIDADNKLGDNVYYEFDSTSGKLTVFGSGATYNYSVGETSGDSPLYGNKNIKKVVIESGVTNIGSGVFAACGVEEVTFSDTVKTISDSAFYDCTALKQVNLSASVSSIDRNAFYGCTALQKFTVPDDSETYKSVDGILFSKDGKTLYKYPTGKDGTTYTVPASVKTVYDCAFRDSKKLVSINFENDDTTIGQRAFASCTALKSISLPKNLTSLENGLFYGCSSLKEISIPAGVTEISDSVFDNATSLEFIVIPNGVDTINISTFLNCSSLKGVIIPSSVDTIKNFAFYGATALKDVYYIGTAENWAANVYISNNNTPLESATMHYIDSANKIGDNVYYEFDSATGALTIVGSGKTYDYKYNKNGYSPFFNRSDIKSVNVAEGVTSIGNCLFYYCDKIESVTLPDSLETIGNIAFCGCESLKSIVIPDNVTTIGSSSFQSTKLETVTLGESLETIYSMAFADTNIKSIVIPDSVISIDSNVFIYCNSLESITVGKGLKNADFSELISLNSITVSEENESFTVVDGVLFNKDKTTLIVYPAKKTGDIYLIPATVKTIGSNAFYGSANLKTIIIPDSVETIEYSAFKSSTSLEKIAIPDSVKTIDSLAFESCTSLKKIALPEGTTDVDVLFDSCEALECIYIPSSVEFIADGAFAECTSLTTVYRSGDVSSPSEGINVMSEYNSAYTNAAVVPNHTHSIESYYVTKKSSCTQDGSRIGICVCGKFLDEETVFAAHTFGEVQHKNADCTSGGYDYKQCSSCNKYFAPDAAVSADNGKSDYSSFTTQKLNHSYTGDMKMDANGKNGTHSFKCVNGCDQYGGAVAHEWNNGEVTTPATHLKEGVKTFKCACGAEYTEPVSKLEGHSYTPTIVLPTCTEQGYTEHKCACGNSYKDTYVDATGHSYENGSCTECGAPDPSYTGDSTSDCDCLCHSSNKFVQFIYKIVHWFWKLFKIHKTCDCGAIHY